MKLLLDTCVLLWWWGEPDKLSPHALALLKDPDTEVFVSSAAAMEIAVKTRIGKLPDGKEIMSSWDDRMSEDGFRELSLSVRHAFKAGVMPGEHRDPFDRMLAAQSRVESLPLLTPDPLIGVLGAETIW